MVLVLGGYQTDFARHLAREGRELADLVGEVIDGALADADVTAAQLGTIHVGNAFGELFTGQAQLGAMPATARPALWGIPAVRHEAACASGSVAILAAIAQLEAGHADVALVVGVEQERNCTGELAAKHLGSAAWTGHEGEGARYLWPHMFATIAEHTSARPEHLAAIAKKNLGNARRNPRAQTRGWAFADDAFGAAWLDDAANPIVEGRLRRHDCAQLTDGACALVLASERFGRRAPRIAGWGHRTAGLPLAAKLERRGDHLLPHLRDAALDAYRRAGIAGPDELDAIEVHDCFTITEYVAIDHLGLTPPGEAWRAIEDGRTERGGATPINVGGGLIGGGHPVGATGVRMMFDAARLVRDGAGRVATLNLGGSATTVVSFVVAS